MTVSEQDLLLQSRAASWNYQRWEWLPDDGSRPEGIDGVLYTPTAPSFCHRRIALQSTQRVGIPLEASGIAIMVMTPVGIIMSGADLVQPDFLLIRCERAEIVSDDGRIRGVPDFIAEVLSSANQGLDTVVKCTGYARAGVPEYWIVRPTRRDVLVCTRPNPNLSDFTSVPNSHSARRLSGRRHRFVCQPLRCLSR